MKPARSLAVKTGNSESSLAVRLADLTSRSDLTFKVLDTLNVEGRDLHQSLLNGSLIRGCTFKNVSFARCDLEQVQFLNCKFIDVDFTNVEMTSTVVDNCDFSQCKFDFFHLEECQWNSCSIQDCSFLQTVIQTSQFEVCHFDNNDVKGSSIQLNTFRGCSFKCMSLGNCTFLNQIMSGCLFDAVQINAESIGVVFGLSEQNLNSLDLVYLGQKVVNIHAPNGLIESLEKDFQERRWHFMLAMLRLNFRRSPRVLGLEACLEALLWPASFGAPLKAGDISFFERVVRELIAQKELPGISAIHLPERIKHFCSQRALLEREQIGDRRLLQLKARLQEILIEMLSDLSSTLKKLTPDAKDQPVVARLIFDQKPKSDVEEFLRDIATSFGAKINGQTSLIKVEMGSYIVFLQTTLLTLAALQIALWLLNGCAHQVIELKSRIKVARQKNLPKAVRERILLPDQNIPKWIASSVQVVFAKLTANSSGLAQVATDFDRGSLHTVAAEKSNCKAPSKATAQKTNLPRSKGTS